MSPIKTNVVLVTGCSTGIGRAIALGLATRGVQVLAGVRREADADSLRRESPTIEPVLLDVADAQSVERVAAMIRQRFPQGLDGLINNAGIAIAGPLELVDLEQWRRQFEVNVLSMVNLTQQLLPDLRRRRGKVINIGSAASHLALPMMGAYASSKAAVDLLTDALRRELRPCGVRVVLVRPGQTATKIYDTAEVEAVGRLDDAVAGDGYDYLPRLRRFQHLMNRSRWLRASPERVARCVVRIYFRRFPRPRYNIGWDAKGAAIVDRLIPPRLVDWIISWRLRSK